MATVAAPATAAVPPPAATQESGGEQVSLVLFEEVENVFEEDIGFYQERRRVEANAAVVDVYTCTYAHTRARANKETHPTIAIFANCASTLYYPLVRRFDASRCLANAQSHSLATGSRPPSPTSECTCSTYISGGTFHHHRRSRPAALPPTHPPIHPPID